MSKITLEELAEKYKDDIAKFGEYVRKRGDAAEEQDLISNAYILGYKQGQESRDDLIKKLVADNADLNQKLQDLMADADLFDTIKQSKNPANYKHPVVVSEPIEVGESDPFYVRLSKQIDEIHKAHKRGE